MMIRPNKKLKQREKTWHRAAVSDRMTWNLSPTWREATEKVKEKRRKQAI
jgi:hypothetical protein